MKTKISSRGLHLKIALILSISSAILSGSDTVLAQLNLTPDTVSGRNLGTTVSPLSPQIDLITGGTRPQNRSNLFHSFAEFNINSGRGVYFANPLGVENILSRVTGNNPSNILGTLGVTGGNANLFLINPNGIIFGNNASLDLRGSFVATTANAILFGNTGIFSASNPASSNLLSIKPSAFLFNSITSQSEIINRSTATNLGLRVSDGKSLLLVGGDVKLENGGLLNALGGRIELGGLAAPGTVGLQINGDTFSLNFPANSVLSNINLASDARVNVRGLGGGDIVVNANNFTATSGGRLVAGTEGKGNGGDIIVNADNFSISGVGFSGLASGINNQSLNSVSANSGNIIINSNKLNISAGSLVGSATLGTGNAGNIVVNSQSLSISEGGGIASITFGSGNTGDVKITSTDLVELTNGYIQTINNPSATGNTGNIEINTSTFTASANAFLWSGINSGGKNSGNITINADSVSFLNGSALYSSNRGGSGNAGKIEINTNSLKLENAKLDTQAQNTIGSGGDILINASDISIFKSLIQSGIFGKGNAGNILLQATGSVSIVGSEIFSFVEKTATGQGGDISILGRSLFLSENTQLRSNTLGHGNSGNILLQATGPISISSSIVSTPVQPTAIGNAGNIRIVADSLSLSDVSVIGSSSFSKGNAGNVSLQVNGPVSFNNSLIATTVEDTGIGKGGNINIKAGSLSLNNDSQFVANTFGKGDSGDIFVQTNNFISLANRSAILSTVGAGGIGNVGNIDIQTRSLKVTDGSQVQAIAFREDAGLPGGKIPDGLEKKGNIRIIATDSVLLSDVSPDGYSSGLFSSTERGAIGTAGDITVTTNAFRVENGAVVNAKTLNSSNGGNITINSNTFVAQDGGQVLTLTDNSGNAGKITINSTNSVTISGGDRTYDKRLAQFGRDIVNNEGSSSGLFSNARQDFTSSGGNLIGSAGNIQVQTGKLQLDNKGQLIAQSTSGNGGNINLQVQDFLLLRRNSEISTSAGTAQKGGDGGNITITNAPFIIAVPSENSDITANAFTGRGGNIQIITSGIYGLKFRPNLTAQSDITASSSFGIQGNFEEINVTGIDITQGLTNLPTELSDASNQIVQRCRATGTENSEENKFVITGRGGLPPNPTETLQGDFVISNWVTLDSKANKISGTSNVSNSRSTKLVLIEATSWVFGPNGEVILTATSPTLTPRLAIPKPVTCPSL